MINHEGSSGAMEKEAAKVRLGNPLSRGVEKPEGPSALQPTTESQVSICVKYNINKDNAIRIFLIMTY